MRIPCRCLEASAAGLLRRWQMSGCCLPGCSSGRSRFGHSPSSPLPISRVITTRWLCAAVQAHRMRLAWWRCLSWRMRGRDGIRHPAVAAGHPCGRMDVQPGCLAPCPGYSRTRVFAHTARPATGRMDAPAGLGPVRHRLWLAGNSTPGCGTARARGSAVVFGVLPGLSTH